MKRLFLILLASCLTGCGEEPPPAQAATPAITAPPASPGAPASPAIPMTGVTAGRSTGLTIEPLDAAPPLGRNLLADDVPAPRPGRNLLADDVPAPRPGRNLLADDVPAPPLGRNLLADSGFVASSQREPFHRPGCRWARKIDGENLRTFGTREAAVAAGHRPCKVCKP